MNSRSTKIRPVPAAQLAQQIQKELDEMWLPRIYAQRVLRLRTRLYEFKKPQPNARVSIQHTLLGIELKIGRQRLLSPDLATARYLSVFARVGCPEVFIPYDITTISHIADELDSSWYRMLLMVDHLAHKQTARFAARLRRTLFANIQLELAAATADRRNMALQQHGK